MSHLGIDWPNIEHGMFVDVSSQARDDLASNYFVRLDLVTPMSQEAHDTFERFLGKSRLMAALWLVLWRIDQGWHPQAAMVLAALNVDVTTSKVAASGFIEILGSLRDDVQTSSSELEPAKKSLPSDRIEVVRDDGHAPPGGTPDVLRRVKEHNLPSSDGGGETVRKLLEDSELDEELIDEIIEAIMHKTA